MTRKRLSLMGLTMAIVLTMLLTACGGAKKEEPAATNGVITSPTTTAAATAAPGKPVSLRLWGGIPEESGPKALVDKWNAANKDIQVEYVRFVNDASGNLKLDTALLSNTDAPDLYVNYSDTNLSRRIDAGMAEPMDDLIVKSGFDVDGVIGKDNITKYNEKMYYLPGSKSMNLMFINKSMLDAVGEKVPTDWTWEEYEALALKLTKQGQYGAYFNPAWEPLANETMISAKPIDPWFAADGTSNFNSEATKKGLEMQKRLLVGKALVPYAEGVANKIQPQDELLKGKAALVYTGTYLIRYVKDDVAYPNRDFKVAFAPLPQMEKGTNANNGGLADKIAINSKSENKEASMKFLAWYLEEGSLELVAGGRIPSSAKIDITKVAELMIGDKEKYIDKESFVNVLKASYTFKSNLNITALAEQRKILTEESEKFFMDVQSIDETIASLKKKNDEAIIKAK